MENKQLYIYVGNYGSYEIPSHVVEKAVELNCGKSIKDKRTKGARYLNWYGRCLDSDKETIEAIKKHIL